MYLVFRRGSFTAWILPCIFSHYTCFPLRIIYSPNARERSHCSLCRRSFPKFKPLAWPRAVIQQSLVWLPGGLEAEMCYWKKCCHQANAHVPLPLLQGGRWARRRAHVKAEPWGVNPRSRGSEHPPAEGCVALRWGNGQTGQLPGFWLQRFLIGTVTSTRGWESNRNASLWLLFSGRKCRFLALFNLVNSF